MTLKTLIPPGQPEWISITEYCKRWHRKRQAVYKARTRGQLPTKTEFGTVWVLNVPFGRGLNHLPATRDDTSPEPKT